LQEELAREAVIAVGKQKGLEKYFQRKTYKERCVHATNYIPSEIQKSIFWRKQLLVCLYSVSDKGRKPRVMYVRKKQ